jgi:hypothetical protein
MTANPRELVRTVSSWKYPIALARHGRLDAKQTPHHGGVGDRGASGASLARRRAPMTAMDDLLARVWDQLMERMLGPMHFRFILQPIVAATLAVRAALRDASQHRPPFLHTLLFDSAERRTLIRSGWTDLGMLYLVACSLDVIYQLFFLHALHLLQPLVVACLLAVVPYVAIRGPLNRLIRRRRTA